jgi:hypothetical protein
MEKAFLNIGRPTRRQDGSGTIGIEEGLSQATNEKNALKGLNQQNKDGTKNG